MGYIAEKVSFDYLKENYQDYSYGLLFMMSEKLLEKTQDLMDVSWDECLEARFFGKSGELHAFRDADDMPCVKVEETDTEDTLTDKYVIESNRQKIGRFIIVRKYLGYDEDGQAYIKLTRLVDIE